MRFIFCYFFLLDGFHDFVIEKDPLRTALSLLKAVMTDSLS